MEKLQGQQVALSPNQPHATEIEKHFTQFSLVRKIF